MIGALLVAAAVCAGAFLVFLLVNLAVLPKLSARTQASGESMPFVSVVIPARNEEKDIRAAVASHLSQGSSELEVVVVDDRSTDGTPQILADLARNDSRLRIVEGKEPPPGWLGKPHALWEGAQAARGDLLLFADADVRYQPGAVAAAVSFLTERGADFLAIVPRIESHGFWENVLMPNLLYLLYCGPAFLANSDRARWMAIGGGAGNLIRRSTYEAIGSHESLKDSVIDDVHLALRVKRSGFRTRVARAEDLVAVRMYRGFREVWNGFSKNAAYLFSGVLGIVLTGFLLATFLLALAPPVILAAAALGAPAAVSHWILAAGVFLLLMLTRAALARAIGEPVWPCWTHSLLAAVWTGIILRSLFHRIVQKRLTWRGREFDARAARF